jgi:hypothetical protein
MNPTKPEISAIQAFVRSVGGWGYGNGQIVDTIKSTMVSNGAQSANVPRPYTIAEIFQSLSPDSLIDVESYPAFYELTVDLKLNNTTQVLAAFETLAATNRITASELSTVTTIVNSTIPDPDHSWYQRWDEATLGRLIDTADINIARHSPGGQ